MPSLDFFSFIVRPAGFEYAVGAQVLLRRISLGLDFFLGPNPVPINKRGFEQMLAYHALRHFGASILEQANVPLGSIQRILGHESRTTTEIYLHSIGDSERVAKDVLDESFGEFPQLNGKGLQSKNCNPLIS